MNEKGAEAEEMACRILEGKGYRILKRNYTTRFGEIDIIAQDGDFLVFVEVKCRGRGSLSSPREAVSRAKRKRIIRSALLFLSSHPSGQPRFDVFEIQEDEKGKVWNHLINAFGAEEYDAPF